MSSNEASNPEPEVGVEATEQPAKQAKKVASAPADTQGEESRDSVVSAEGDESVEGDEDEVGDEEEEEEDTDEEAAAEKPRNGHAAKNGAQNEATVEAVNGTADAKNRKRSAPNDEEDGEEAAPTTESSAEDNVAQKKKRVDEPQQPDQPQVEAGAE